MAGDGDDQQIGVMKIVHEVTGMMAFFAHIIMDGFRIGVLQVRTNATALVKVCCLLEVVGGTGRSSTKVCVINDQPLAGVAGLRVVRLTAQKIPRPPKHTNVARNV